MIQKLANWSKINANTGIWFWFGCQIQISAIGRQSFSDCKLALFHKMISYSVLLILMECIYVQANKFVTLIFTLCIWERLLEENPLVSSKPQEKINTASISRQTDNEITNKFHQKVFFQCILCADSFGANICNSNLTEGL